MSILEMQIHMQEKRKKKAEKDAQRKRKLKAKEAAGKQVNRKGRVGGGFGGANNAYGVGAQELGLDGGEEDKEN